MSLGEYIKSKAGLVFWLIVIGGIMTWFACTQCHDSIIRYLLVWAFSSSIWIFMWLGNEYIVHTLDEKIFWTREPVKRLLVGLAAMAAYSIAAIVILIVSFEFAMGAKINTRTETIYTSVGLAFLITMIMTSRSFLFNWRQSAIDAEKLQKESMAAKYESLKNQVNPHFLFNSFNALTNLVYEDQDKAAKFIKQLSDVYRYVLDTREKEVVPIAEELKFLNSYTYLQQIRFGDKLKIKINLNGIEAGVPPLALQMLIENAIKHNVASEEHPLTITVYQENDFIVVENNKQLKSVIAEPSAGVGLENISKRYEFLTNKKVEVLNNEMTFVVKLPSLQPLD